MTPRPRLVVFLGPSLPAEQARRVASCRLLPPARQGDVWRALALRPAAIALVDGVFESTPAVWHHELLDALDAGVAVFGGASMGALRAAELDLHGMIGIGRIYGWFRAGAIRGDDEVALLHGGIDSGFRPLTVPLVTVRRTLEVAEQGQIVTRRGARAVLEAAAGLFYQDRTWPRILEGAARRLEPAALDGLRRLLRTRPPDPKAEDARATIQAAADFVRSGAALPPPAPRRRPSSLVRRRKLWQGVSPAAGRAIPSALVLAALARDRGAASRLRDQGLRHALLASFARTLGLQVSADRREAAAQAFFSAHGVDRRGRVAFLAASGLDAADAGRFFEDLALERALLDAALRAVPDGPSDEEALALGGRLSGRWAAIARRAASRGAAPARPWTARRARSRIGDR